MRLDLLKNWVGFTLVGLHIVSIVLTYVWLDSRLETQQFRITILILVPVPAVYALAYVKDAARNMFNTDRRASQLRVTKAFSALAMIFTLFFSLLVIFTLYQYKSGSGLSPDDLKDRLALIEVMTGAFLGLVVETLFGRIERNNDVSKQG